MEGNKNKSRAILVFGAPCSGKTTFCEQFAKRFGVAFFDLDAIKTEYNLSRKLVIMLLTQIAKTKKTVILEGGLGTEKERNEIRRVFQAAGYVTSTIWIQTDIVTIRTRLKNKYHSITKAKEVYDTVLPTLEAPSEIESPIILSGKHTFDTQLRHTLTGLRWFSKIKNLAKL